MKTTGRRIDRSLPPRVYEQVEYLKAKGIRVGDAIGIVAPQIGKSRGATTGYYYAYRRRLAANSRSQDAHTSDIPPAGPMRELAQAQQELADRLDVIEKLLRKIERTKAQRSP